MTCLGAVAALAILLTGCFFAAVFSGVTFLAGVAAGLGVSFFTVDGLDLGSSGLGFGVRVSEWLALPRGGYWRVAGYLTGVNVGYLLAFSN
jgi:hypothetical protein